MKFEAIDQLMVLLFGPIVGGLVLGELLLKIEKVVDLYKSI